MMLMPQPVTPAPARGAHRAVFLDKDGTLVEDVPYNVDPAKLRFTPHALEGLALLVRHGFLLVLVSNQPGVALGFFPAAALQRIEQELARRLAGAGIALSGFRFCPHAPAAAETGGSGVVGTACRCRKPAPGLLQDAAADLSIDLQRSWMVGDILDDIEAGHRAGCRTVLLDVGNETIWRLSTFRMPDHRADHLLHAAQTIVMAEERTSP